MIWRYGLLSAALIASATAQTAEPKSDTPQDGISRQQADAIVGELREIRLLLEKITKTQLAAPVAPAKVSLKIAPGSPMLGDRNAPLTIVEYMDMQCSYCKRFHEITFADIRKNFIDTGKVRYYSRDYPLPVHPFAKKAAEAAHCAAEQDQFWRMRELLLTNTSDLNSEAILGFAKTAGLDTVAFSSCLGGAKYDEPIKNSLTEGSAIGVHGTPSFVVGKSTPDGVVGILFAGARPYPAFEAELKKLEGK